MPEPRADFACLSKKCRTDEGATVYELPVAATRCAVCGSKRINRIWTPPHIGRGLASRVDGMLEHSGLREQLEQRDRRRAVEHAEREFRPGDAVVAGHAANLGSLMQKATAPWTGGQPVFGGISAGSAKKAATVDGLAIYNGSRGHTPMPASGARVNIPGAGTLALRGGPRPTPESLSDGKGRPKV